MVISPLRRKVLRDLRRLWAQVLAIALVLAAGVATLILGNGASSSLTETRTRYYDDSRFADVFADVVRAPLGLLADIKAIDGVLHAEARIVKLGRPDLPEMLEPAALLFVSLPEAGDLGLNRLYLRQGRLPEPESSREIIISEGFATAHRLKPGMPLDVVLNGRRLAMRVTGIALSPEYIYALGPGQMMPDPRRFGIAWAPRASLEAAFNLEGAFSNVVLKLVPGTPADRVVSDLDRLTARYGGMGATGRKDQLSHAFLDAELNQLSAMVKVLPPVFLLVAAMLVNMTLSRLIVLEREQIGLLKAIGYSSRAVSLHYMEFVFCICAIGTAIGFGAGAWLGAGLAGLYARFFSFPFLVFTRDPGVYGLAALVAAVSATGGALRAVQSVARLPPAVAMLPPAPPVYQTWRGRFRHPAGFRRTGVMIARHLFRWPVRTFFSILGVAMSVAVLVASLWSTDSVNHMTDITFFQAERQDVSITFVTPQPARAVFAGRNLPGVLVAEPFRTVPATLSHRNHSRRVAVTGRPRTPHLSRVLSPDLRPMAMPEAGLILSEALAEALDLRPGESVTAEFLEGGQPKVTLPVSGISIGYVGLGAAMDLTELNRIMGNGQVVSGLNLMVDEARKDAFFTAVKTAPGADFVTVRAVTVNRFKETLAENITVMISVYAVLAMVLAVGVVYNFARIALSEQGRELASLRVLGFTRREVSGILLGELAFVVVLAQPLGWSIGYGIGLAMVSAFSSDLYRVPFVIGRDVYATASLAVIGAALASAWLIRGRINALDMVRVLKTRE